MEPTKPIDHNDIQPQEAEKHRLGYMDVYAPVLPTKTQSQALKLISSVATWTCHDAEHIGRWISDLGLFSGRGPVFQSKSRQSPALGNQTFGRQTLGR